MSYEKGSSSQQYSHLWICIQMDLHVPTPYFFKVRVLYEQFIHVKYSMIAGNINGKFFEDITYIDL